MGRCEKTLSRLSRCHALVKKKCPQLGKFCSLTGEQKFASSLFGKRQQQKAHLFAAEGGKCKENVFPLPFSPLALESMVGFRYYFTTIFFLPRIYMPGDFGAATFTPLSVVYDSSTLSSSMLRMAVAEDDTV